MTSIYVPTWRRGEPSEGRALWGDLRVCLMSLEAYALDYVDEIVVAWDGPWAPDGMPEHPKFRYIERPPGLNQILGIEFAIDQTRTEELIMVSDDAVFHPDTARVLLEDVEFVRSQAPTTKIGLMGLRTNYAIGVQNVRQPNGTGLDQHGFQFLSENQILATDRVVTFVVWFTKAAYEVVGRLPTDLIMYSDMLWSYDLEQRGYTNFISRAYAHHIGSRGTAAEGVDAGRMYEEAVAWLAQHRPDFVREWVRRGHMPANALTYLAPATTP